MTLGDLLYSTTVQGNVLLSFWENGEEIHEGCVHNTFDLRDDIDSIEGIDSDQWESAYINYLFSDDDGWLHIEVERDG